MPRLQISLPDGAETTHELTEDAVTIGRVEDNDLQIDDISVSSHHAQLTRNGPDYILRDLGSTNGTRLNGREVAAEEDHPLSAGDSISFGNVPVVYASEEAAEALPMPAETEVAATPAESSVRPSDFANASPFQKRSKPKDPARMAILGLSALAILAFFGAAAVIMTLQSPL